MIVKTYDALGSPKGKAIIVVRFVGIRVSGRSEHFYNQINAFILSTLLNAAEPAKMC